MEPLPLLNVTDHDGPLKITPQFWFNSVAHANVTIQLINVEIGKISNPLLSKEQKTAALEEIKRLVVEMENNLSPYFSGFHPEYQRNIRWDLFNSLQAAEQSLRPKRYLPNFQSPSLSDIIKNMSPDKAQRFVDLLSQTSSNNPGFRRRLKKNLEELYLETDDSEQARNFRNFLRGHDFSFLGGGNSKNFKVTSRMGFSEVLMVEETLGESKSAAVAFLSKPEGKLLTNRTVERPVGKKTLVVTECCRESLDHLMASENPSIEDLQRKSAIWFRQMAKAMIDIEKAGFFFPDAKSSNWLIDFNEKLRVSDRKSFKSSPGGIYERRSQVLDRGAIIRTDGYTPPEYNTSNSISVDKAHAYILGCNLLKSLTGYGLNTFVNYQESWVELSHFSAFQGEIGLEYLKLIKSLLNPDPMQRISVHEAESRLKFIERLIAVPPESRAQLITTFNQAFNDFELMKSVFPKISDQIAQEQKEALRDITGSTGVFKRQIAGKKYISKLKSY